MKKLIYLFLLILPFSVHSQITFNDLKKLDSKEDFQRLCIEQGFERARLYEEGENMTCYGYQLTSNSEEASIWGFYYNWSYRGGEFYFSFPLDDQYLGFDGVYEKITRDIKASCSYYSIEEEDGYDVIYYSCPGSLYQGKIGFWREGGLGHIITNSSLGK